MLSRVIAVEKEIQARIDDERARAGAWLETARAEAEEACRRESELRREALKISFENSMEEARARALTIVREAEEDAAGLLALEDEVLRGIVARRLPLILPE